MIFLEYVGKYQIMLHKPSFELLDIRGKTSRFDNQLGNEHCQCIQISFFRHCSYHLTVEGSRGQLFVVKFIKMKYEMGLLIIPYILNIRLNWKKYLLWYFHIALSNHLRTWFLWWAEDILCQYDNHGPFPLRTWRQWNRSVTNENMNFLM